MSSTFLNTNNDPSERNEIATIQRKLAFSTTTPLAANAVYTSPTVDMLNYKVYTLYLTSDVAGSFFTQWSDDGINWFNSSGTSTALAANGVGGSAGGVAVLRYMRIVYTNGAAAQTIFKVSSYALPL